MTYSAGRQPPGWYHAHGDPPLTQRYWDGTGWIGTPRPAPGSAGGDELEMALPLPRIGARLVDCVVWAIGLSLAALVAGTFGGAGDGSGWQRAMALVAFAALVVAYEALMVGRFGATLGKLAVGLRVRRQDGSPADPATGVRRALPLAVFAVAAGVVVLSPWWLAVLGVVVAVAFIIAGLVSALTDRLRQTPWDRLADTIVVAGGAGSVRRDGPSRIRGDEHAEDNESAGRDTAGASHPTERDEAVEVQDGPGDDERA